MILYRSLWKDLVVKSSTRSLHEDLEDESSSKGACKYRVLFVECSEEILVLRSCKILEKVLLWRSYESLLDVLAWRPGRYSSCTFLVTKQVAGDAFPTMSNLSCVCSVATVVCISYIHFLLPHCLGSLAGVINRSQNAVMRLQKPRRWLRRGLNIPKKNMNSYYQNIRVIVLATSMTHLMKSFLKLGTKKNPHISTVSLDHVTSCHSLEHDPSAWVVSRLPHDFPQGFPIKMPGKEVPARELTTSRKHISLCTCGM